ncbi:MAG: molybdate ABC transporter substrate-binding protein [Opitutales bacterium]
MHTSLAGIVCLFSAWSLAGCVKAPPERVGEIPELTVHAAVSLSRVVEDLADAFAAQHACRFNFNFASSGALARQLIAAPRGELFLSANPEWMQRVVDAGAVREATAEVLFANQLVVVGNLASQFAPVGIEPGREFCGLAFEYLSIGDPAYVPVGQYAHAWLRTINCGTSDAWTRFQDRILPANDAHAALARVRSSAGIIGIVYQTDYQAQADAYRLLYAVPQESGPPIQYLGAILKAAHHPDLSAAFLDFIQSSEGRTILSHHGFGPLER